jgi:hypothetical protein
MERGGGARLLFRDIMLQSLLETLPDLLGGDGLQVGGREDPVNDGRVLRSFCWEDYLLISLALLACPFLIITYAEG